MSAPVENVVPTSLWSYLFTVGGVVLALFAIARLVRERRQPANTLAWFFGIILAPYVVVPFYLLVGGRKLARVAATKTPLLPLLPGSPAPDETLRDDPVAHTIRTNGADHPIGGNAVRLTPDAEQAYAELMDGIRSARHSIHVTTFILGRDKTGREFIRLLAARAREGVKVRLLLDGLGCILVRRRHLRPLIEAGGEIRRFMPMLPLMPRSSANLRNHRKIAVFDQRTAIVGGRNIAREYMGATPWKKRWNDLGAVITGPGAALLNEVFLADWAYAGGRDVAELHGERDPAALVPAGDSALHIVPSGPDVNGDPLFEGIISMIQEAKRSVWIVTPYFIPDEVLLRSLVVKARAGRDVTLIVPARSNHPITDAVRRPYLRQLIRAGVRVLIFQPGMMHSKAMVVDDRIGLVGSANFDMRSLFVNFEVGVVLYSQPDVARLRAWCDEMARHCEELPLERIRHRRFSGKLAEDLVRLLAPLL